MSKDANTSGKKWVFIGFGSITKATLGLLVSARTIELSSAVVIAPQIEQHQPFVDLGVSFIDVALTPENLGCVLCDVVRQGDFIVNLSVNVSSADLIRFAHAHGALYLDTCIEPWVGTYNEPSLSTSQRSNYALRDQLLSLKSELGPGPTAVVTHGANPGLVSHFVKSALLQLAAKLDVSVPDGQEGVAWGELAMALNVKVIHIAERDTQRSSRIKTDDEFVNTWSVDGFVSEAGQPAELGWGSHEKTWPPFAHHHLFGSNSAIYLERPGASVSVKTWTPNGGPCIGLLITHNEAISLPDFLTVKVGETLLYRPTVYYAYHPCDDALLSVHEYVGRGWRLQNTKRIMNDEIAPGGVDALGVLLMGHALNAYWYGSILSIDEARQIAPFNTATSLQVATGVYSGIIWAIENPDRGIVEPEQMDHQRVLEIALPFLGSLQGIQTNWTPLDTINALFHKPEGELCPWQFEHFTAV
ncbi:homospermidine synthase [Pseudomonas gessardii]|uniref:Homospermidine synthase n=1 Tax=Pseudomonas gessardii TaxID=78544 RepID=A0ABS9FDL8_9PSED|nr:saccharopine dehydrogenase C-terminal domain-containing protein [Pseudomonas gessardii]MCF4982361.1 homospermidine synthase [Pseudomonas gessardii]MCF4992335.1 homospermidine synthase [Pseudomonas gessardii]MCF5087986.1 homospermidine synthase [Pseudomonas gessardii]MCF5109477.1 homospermidine synthase [Pseudomonas gessardii]